MASVQSETPAQAAFLAASERVDKVGFNSISVVCSDGETRTTVKLEPKIWYQVAEVSDPIPIDAA
jgi:hypothetical protein